LGQAGVAGDDSRAYGNDASGKSVGIDRLPGLLRAPLFGSLLRRRLPACSECEHRATQRNGEWRAQCLAASLPCDNIPHFDLRPLTRRSSE
jgi:hypothetical protein